VSQIIVDSLIAGSVYMVMALGIIAVFKTTRVFNFAHGQMAAFGGYIAYAIDSHYKVPFVVLALAGAGAGAALAVATERLILARLYQRSVLELVVATFGISLILRAGIQRIWGFDTLNIRAPFPRRNVEILGTSFSAYGALVIVVAVAIIIVLSVVLNRTDIGLALRSTFDDPVAARLTGIKVARVRTASWLLGGALAGLGGVLLTPLVYLTTDTMDIVLIIAFAAAVVGGLSSFYGAMVGGFAVALTSNVVANYISLEYRNVLVYAAVLVFLWVRPHGLFGEEESEQASQEGERAGLLARLSSAFVAASAARAGAVRTRVLRGYAPQWIVVAAVLVLMFAAPSILGRSYQLNLTTWLVDFVAVAGLAVMAFYAGRISLAQTAFMAVGAYSMPHLLDGRPGMWPLALVAAALLAAVAGLLFEIPSLRLHGAYYAVATLVLALLTPLLADKWRSVTGGVDGIAVPYATWHGDLLDTRTMYYVFACIAGGVIVLLLALRNSPIGRSVVAIRDSPHGAASLGLSSAPRRVAAASLGAGLGGLAGAMSGIQNNVVTGAVFSLEFALTLFVAAVLAGSLIGSAWGAAVIVLVPVWLKNQPLYATGAFGLILIVTLFLLPRGREVADVLRRARPVPPRREIQESVAVGAPAEAGRDDSGASAPVVPTRGRSHAGNETRRSL
jgi:branched-chain amino acid transport system permease protein